MILGGYPQQQPTGSMGIYGGDDPYGYLFNLLNAGSNYGNYPMWDPSAGQWQSQQDDINNRILSRGITPNPPQPPPRSKTQPDAPPSPNVNRNGNEMYMFGTPNPQARQLMSVQNPSGSLNPPNIGMGAPGSSGSGRGFADGSSYSQNYGTPGSGRGSPMTQPPNIGMGAPGSSGRGFADGSGMISPPNIGGFGAPGSSGSGRGFADGSTSVASPYSGAPDPSGRTMYGMGAPNAMPYGMGGGGGMYGMGSPYGGGTGAEMMGGMTGGGK